MHPVCHADPFALSFISGRAVLSGRLYCYTMLCALLMAACLRVTR